MTVGLLGVIRLLLSGRRLESELALCPASARCWSVIRLQIDAYQLHTGDKAIWRDHYYSDKPPGTSLMVLPAVAAACLASRMAGVDPESFPGIAWTSYVAAVSSAGVFTVRRRPCSCSP